MATPFYTRLAHVLICLVGLFYIAILGHAILAPICFALLFSLLLLPLAVFFERRCRMPRVLASILSLLALIVALASVILILANQLGALTQDIPAFREHLDASVGSLQEWVSATFHIDNTKQMTYVKKAADSALGKGGEIVSTTLLSVSSIVLFLVFTLLYTFLILVYRRLLMYFVVSVFSSEYTATVREVVSQIQYIMRKYVTGLLLQMLIVTTTACTIFWIIGIKYAFLLGLITGIFNVIPYIGIFTAMALSAVVTFSTMEPINVLFVTLSILGLHFIDANFLMPKVVGSKVKINPIAALLGLVIGEMCWGIKGMFLAIPVLAVCKVVFDRVEGLRPWGVFLGEEDSGPLTVIPTKRKKKRPYRPRRREDGDWKKEKSAE